MKSSAIDKKRRLLGDEVSFRSVFIGSRVFHQIERSHTVGTTFQRSHGTGTKLQRSHTTNKKASKITSSASSQKMNYTSPINSLPLNIQDFLLVQVLKYQQDFKFPMDTPIEMTYTTPAPWQYVVQFTTPTNESELRYVVSIDWRKSRYGVWSMNSYEGKFKLQKRKRQEEPNSPQFVPSMPFIDFL